MPSPFKGLITGTLGYELRKEFLANSLMIKELEVYNYDIYSVDFSGFSSFDIQEQIKREFSGVYSGDVNVKVFNTQNALQYPTDSIRAARYTVNVEIPRSIPSVSENIFSELKSGYYKGIDYNFWSQHGKNILDFREDYSFSINDNGNREFNHSLSFSLKTGSGDFESQIARKNYAQEIASGIFDKDKETTLGILLNNEILEVADADLFRNYYNESYNYFKNSYSFSRKREQLPFSKTNTLFNINHSLSMGDNGIIEITEKASSLGKIDFSTAKDDLEDNLSESYNRCVSLYDKFYNLDTKLILQDIQYSAIQFPLLNLINTPSKLIKNYDANSLNVSYDVTYTNNPQFSGDGSITSQTVQFNIDQFNKVEATHSYDYTLNKIKNDASYFIDLFSNTTGESPSLMADYYDTNYPQIKQIYPNLNLTQSSADFPNLKTKASVRFTYSNNPTYFITINGKKFKILDITIDKKNPTDIVNEYKIINRTTKSNKSVLSYAYQTDRGEIQIKVTANLGKYSKQFYPDNQGDFSYVGESQEFKLSDYLKEIYKLAGQKFLEHFSNELIGFNWFISDSSYSFDSDGVLNVSVNYVYTLKKRNPPAGQNNF